MALTPDRSTDALRRELRNAGFSKEAIDAAWPKWWNEEAATSPSARAELRFALARNLGISPKSLIDERVEFVWRDQARFKNLSGQHATEQAALNSFGTSNDPEPPPTGRWWLGSGGSYDTVAIHGKLC